MRSEKVTGPDLSVVARGVGRSGAKTLRVASAFGLRLKLVSDHPV